MQTIQKLQILFLVIISNVAFSQSTVTGVVLEKSGLPIIGANVFIEGSYDGTVTEVDGSFEFSTDLNGEQSLSVSYLSFETKNMTMDVSSMKGLKIELRESASTLDAVVISAGTFKAGDNSKLAVLKPLEIVTTAGSMGDVIAAIQTLPGTQANPDDGRLFVRGGDARETKIHIDGMRVFSPYSRTVAGTPSRGRYSPFLFNGVSFSTGGYDAEFGQALSGVLDMNTIDDPNQTETNLSLMTIGLGVGHTHKKEKSSISFSGSYIDFTPYYWLAPTKLDIKTPFKGFSGELVHRLHIGEGLLKNYIAGEWGIFKFSRNNINTNNVENLSVDNRNLYFNSTYSSILSDKHSFRLGFSSGYNQDEFKVDEFVYDGTLLGVHFKAQMKTIYNDFFIVNYGAEYIQQKNTIALSEDSDFYFDDKVTRSIPAIFSSADYFFNKDLALKVGLRYEHNSLFNTNELDPRITMAYKLNKASQVSFAFGRYNQEIDEQYLYEAPVFQNEKATHYLLNYNIKNDKHFLRLEGYYKSYRDLISYTGENVSSENRFTDLANEGLGEAYGLDLFWRGDQIIKNVDLRVSYSWLQNERKYQSYPTFATPNFSTTHNFSFVTRTWFQGLNSQLGVTYSMASGRPYDNPNNDAFMAERSKPYHNISISWSYLITQQKILFLSVSNAPRFKNEFGRRYADNRNMQGVYPSELIRPNDDQFFFVGFFITLSEDKMKNQLDNL